MSEEKPNALKTLETGVTRVASSIQTFGKTFERIAAELSEEDMKKAFHYLHGVFIAAQERAALDHRIAQGVSPTFSLADVKLPPAVTVVVNNPPLTGTPTPLQAGVPASPILEPGADLDLTGVDGKTAAKLIGGRLTRAGVQAARAPRVRKYQSVNADLHSDEEQPTTGGADDNSEVDFIAD